MKLDEAKAVCERWFAHLDKQRAKSVEMQRIAAAVRSGEIEQPEAQRRVRMLDSGLTVYDGAQLEQAVKLLLKHVR